MTLQAAIEQLAELLDKRKAMLAVAESCTGGGIGYNLTSRPGSSHWFERGFVVYTNNAKREMLGVKTDMLSRFGAVSEPVARAMAEGALSASRARYSMSVTGIAGPGGGTQDKPVGTVCFAWAGLGCDTQSETHHFQGDRESVRSQSIETAISGMTRFILATKTPHHVHIETDLP